MAQNLGAKKGQFSGWRNRLDGVSSTVQPSYTQEKRVVKVRLSAPNRRMIPLVRTHLAANTIPGLHHFFFVLRNKIGNRSLARS